jgi:hypothetical protein
MRATLDGWKVDTISRRDGGIRETQGYRRCRARDGGSGGVTYTSRETIVDIGLLHATADRERTLPISPVVGVAAVAGGVALLIAGVQKRA